MTLTPEQVAFLARLGKSPDGKFLVSVYQAELADLDGKLRKASGDDIYRLQGRAQQLDEMIERLTRSPKEANSKPRTPVASQGFGE